jgi:hypothetical protein
VGDNKVLVSIDETTDVCGRYVAIVVIGTLFADRLGDIFLQTYINDKVLEISGK